MDTHETRLRNRLSEEMLHWALMISEEGYDVLTPRQRDIVLNRFNAVPRAIALGPVGRATCQQQST